MYKSIGKAPLQIMNIIAFILLVLANIAAGLGLINDTRTGEISQKYPTLFTPAPYTFMIWGFIYILLLIFVIYQARDIFKEDKAYMPFLKDIGLGFIASSILNILWLFAWHNEKLFISVIIMILLLLSVIKIYTNINENDEKYTKIDKLIVKLPFSIYLAWLTVATIANISVFLKSINFSGFGLPEVFYFALVLILLLVITILVVSKYKDLPYLLTIIWAVIGIVVARTSAQVPTINMPDINGIYCYIKILLEYIII